jgi:hypothetical protein
MAQMAGNAGISATVLFALLVQVTALTAMTTSGDERMGAICPAVLAAREELQYRVSWMDTTAGTLTIKLQGPVTHRGRPAMQASVVAETSKFFSRFFRVRDRVESCFSPLDFRSLVFRKRIREGRYRRVERIRYDHESGTFEREMGKLMLQKKQEGTIPEGVLDPIGGLYYLRAEKLEPGQPVRFQANADGKNYEIEVAVLGPEWVKTRSGKWWAYRLEPSSNFQGRVLKERSRITLWLTADELRLPVLIKADVTIGSLRAELLEFTREEDPPPGDGADPALSPGEDAFSPSSPVAEAG